MVPDIDSYAGEPFTFTTSVALVYWTAELLLGMNIDPDETGDVVFTAK